MNPAPVDSNQPENDLDCGSACLQPGTSGSADDGTSGRIVAENSSVDPEQIQRSASCQREVDELVAGINARTRRLEELLGAFRTSTIPLVVTNSQRFALMQSGCYLTALWTRNERDI